jgi:hypothetical protein
MAVLLVLESWYPQQQQYPSLLPAAVALHILPFHPVLLLVLDSIAIDLVSYY